MRIHDESEKSRAWEVRKPAELLVWYYASSYCASQYFHKKSKRTLASSRAHLSWIVHTLKGHFILGCRDTSFTLIAIGVSYPPISSSIPSMTPLPLHLSIHLPIQLWVMISFYHNQSEPKEPIGTIHKDNVMSSVLYADVTNRSYCPYLSLLHFAEFRECFLQVVFAVATRKAVYE